MTLARAGIWGQSARQARYHEIFEQIMANNLWFGDNNAGTRWFRAPDEYEVKTESREKAVDGIKYFSMGRAYRDREGGDGAAGPLDDGRSDAAPALGQPERRAGSQGGALVISHLMVGPRVDLTKHCDCTGDCMDTVDSAAHQDAG